MFFSPVPVHFSAAQFRKVLQLIFRISTIHISLIKADCEETESHLKAATKNLNYFTLNEAFFQMRKNGNWPTRFPTFCMEVETRAPRCLTTKQINVLNNILKLIVSLSWRAAGSVPRSHTEESMDSHLRKFLQKSLTFLQF